jgi:hypothetical protein
MHLADGVYQQARRHVLQNHALRAQTDRFQDVPLRSRPPSLSLQEQVERNGLYFLMAKSQVPTVGSDGRYRALAS